MNLPIYLDNCATTAVDPRVLEAMLPYLKERFGNPASRTHTLGAEVERDIQQARRHIATLIGAQADEIVFTSGATESNNLALIGAARKYREKGRHIISCRSEHPAVLDPCDCLKPCGFEITLLEVDREGMIDLSELERRIREDTILISIMTANNETGAVHPVAEIGGIARRHQVLFHTDATQAIGKIPMEVNQMQIDLLSFSGHKLYGPKGVGALYVRSQSPRVCLEPVLHGGGQEGGFRSGTLNVPGIMGLAAACQICAKEMAEESKRLKHLTDRFYDLLREGVGRVTLNGPARQRLGHVLNVAFADIDSETLMLALPDLAVASGAACTTTSVAPSHVLSAMDLPPQRAQSSLRFSLGRYNRLEEIEAAAEMVASAVKKLRHS